MECDNCTDGLLDVTDALHRDFEPLFNQFQVLVVVLQPEL
jgi:hypothetical protein